MLTSVDKGTNDDEIKSPPKRELDSITNEDTANLMTYNSTSYIKLKELVHSYTASVISNEDLAYALPLGVYTISKVKRQLLGVYYKIKPEYL